MSQTTDIWGADIALDAQSHALVAANGELVLTDGVSTGVQDIKLRLFTYLGTLFYDRSYGSKIYDYAYGDNMQENRSAFLADVLMCVEADPRVVPHSVKTSILKYDESLFIASLQWRFIDVDQPLNLVMQANKATKELIIKDADFKQPELVVT